MSWRQMTFLFFCPRDDKGRPELDEGKPYDTRAGFRTTCYLNGITDPVKQEQLWIEHKKRYEPRPTPSPDNANGRVGG